MENFAYLFERFPSFNQTFCSREVEEMIRQGMEPLVLSIRGVQEQTAADFPAEPKVHYLPPPAELESEAKKLREQHLLPARMSRLLGGWGESGDKMRVYEAAHLGPILKQRGVRHVHVHFAGIAARTAFWIRKFYGIGFSFTGHANDIFLETDFAVSLGHMVEAARFVVTPSDFSREWLAAKFPKHAPKIFGVYNGIRVEKFKTARRESPGALKIVSVGRYVEKKGFCHLIEACRLLKARKIPVHCEIVGDGPLREELAAQIARHDLGGTVLLAGPRSQAELIPLLADSGVFVLPCVREEGGGMDNLPTVIMEAMAAGLPVVSTGVAGVPEMILDGRTGWIVPEKDPAALADAIARVARTPDLARQCAERGQQRAAELFSVEITVRRLKRLLVRFGGVRPGPRAFEWDPALKRRLFERWTGLNFGGGISHRCDGR